MPAFREFIACFVAALCIALAATTVGCSRPRPATCTWDAAVALDGQGQAYATGGEYDKSASDFDEAAQGFAACAEALSDDNHYRALYQQATALGGEARSLYQTGDAKANDVVSRAMAIYRDLATDSKADVTTNRGSSITIRRLAALRSGRASSDLGLPMPTPYFVTAAAAENHCPSDLVVYVEWPANNYYPAAPYGGVARFGAFVCKADAVSAGYGPSLGM
jgi:hypothetical protein